MYKVIHSFADLQDDAHLYNPGDVFPREGLEPSRERYAELAGSSNKIGEPLIAEVEDEKPKKPVKKSKKDK